MEGHRRRHRWWRQQMEQSEDRVGRGVGVRAEDGFSRRIEEEYEDGGWDVRMRKRG